MKRLLSLVLAILCMLGCMASLVSCNNESDVPVGMQLVRGGEEYGYYFYCPEEWIVSNDGNISACYVSKLDTTSVLFTEAQMPSDLNEYFTNEMNNLKATFTEFKLEKQMETEALFGDAKKAYKSIYTYKYAGNDFRTMLIYVVHNGRFFIFTYTAQLVLKNGEQTKYDYYLNKVQTIIDTFKFVEKKGTATDKVNYPTDKDGYILVSNKAECGFDLYVPGNYTVDNATGFVSASTSDGANISMTKPTYTGLYADAYWEKRKADLESLNITITFDEDKIGKEVELDGTTWAFSYEYEWELLGAKTHVYQVLVLVGSEGYVFTYSAPSGEVYDAHINEAIASLSKMGY